MDNNNGSKGLKTKKCPYCYTPLAVDDKKCFACKKKVGDIDKYGMAQKPIDWMSYITALLMWCLFCLFLWWSFLKQK